jgi:hypothetical protein
MDQISNGDIVYYASTTLQVVSNPSIDVHRVKVVSIKYQLVASMIGDRVIDMSPFITQKRLFRTYAEARQHGIAEMRSKVQAVIDWVNEYEQHNQEKMQ